MPNTISLEKLFGSTGQFLNLNPRVEGNLGTLGDQRFIAQPDALAIPGINPLPPLAPPPRPVVDTEPTEDEMLGEVQVAPGIETIGGRRAPAAADTPARLNQEEVRRLVSSVGDPGAGLSEVRLPDGTLVKGITPDALQNQQTSVEGGGDAGSFLDFFGSPEFQVLAGRIAQSIVPDITHGVNVAGGFGAELGTNRAYTEYAERLQAGEPIESINQDPTFQVLSPGLKSQALKDVLSEKQQRVTEGYTGALTEQARATTAGALTREDKLRESAISNAVRLKVAEVGDNNWMNIGQGHVFNIDSGEIVKAYPYQIGGQGVGNLNSSDYRLFNEYTSAVWLPLAEANKRAEIIRTQGEGAAKVVDLSRFFKNDDGSTNFQAIMRYLSDVQRTQFSTDLNQYTLNASRGLPPTTTFQQQQTGIITHIDPTTGEVMHLRINPDGTATRIR